MIFPFVEKHCIQGGSNFPAYVTTVAKRIVCLIQMTENKLFSLVAKITNVTEPALISSVIEVTCHH